MSANRLELPGQVGIGVIHVPGNNANAVATTIQAGPNQIQICVAGGLTKRQQLAGIMLAGLCAKEGLNAATGDDLCVAASLRLADTLLAAPAPVAD